MYIIIMNNNKTLTTSKRVTLYEGDNLADKLRFLFPQTYSNISLADCVVTLNYIDATGQEQSEILVKDNELYKDRLSYRYPVDSKFTRFYGDIVFTISFSMDNIDNILFHTESHTITINPRQDSIPPEEIIPPDSAGKILKEVYELKENIKNLEVKDVVKYVEQTLTEEEKTQARKNIDAISIDEIPEVEIPNPVQSDWNQNDETAPDYVKNRTHYIYDGTTIDKVFFEGENLKFEGINQSMLIYQYTFTSPLLLNSETEYLIQINNHTIVIKLNEPISIKNYGEIILYNTHIFISGKEMPNKNYIKLYTVKDTEVVVPLDDKFVPDTILRFEVEETLELPDVEMTVTDDGNGNVIVETYGIDIEDDGNGNISITSEYMTVIDDDAGNVIINV